MHARMSRARAPDERSTLKPPVKSGLNRVALSPTRDENRCCGESLAYDLGCQGQNLTCAEPVTMQKLATRRKTSSVGNSLDSDSQRRELRRRWYTPCLEEAHRGERNVLSVCPTCGLYPNCVSSAAHAQASPRSQPERSAGPRILVRVTRWREPLPPVGSFRDGGHATGADPCPIAVCASSR